MTEIITFHNQQAVACNETHAWWK